MTLQANAGQVEKVLEDLIARLTRSQSTAEVRAALIEAKRLRNVTTRWAAIPPPPDARREMLTRVMELISQVSASLSKPPPPLDAKPSSPPAISDRPPPKKNSGAPERAVSARAFRATEPAIDSVRGTAMRKPRSDAPDSEGPATLTPREALARGFTPPPIPAVVARGLTPTSPQGRVPPLSQRPGQQRSAPAADDFASPLTPRSRTGDSFPPPPTSSPKPARTSPPPEAPAPSSSPSPFSASRSSPPPPLRGRKPSDMGGAGPSSPPRQGFGSASRSKTKTGLAEAEEERIARSNLPTAPPPPLSPAPPKAAQAAIGSPRRETRLMGSHGVSDAIAALAEGTERNPEADETVPPPSPMKVSISATPSPAPVNAVSVPREGRLEGFSSSISMPNLRPVRPSSSAAKKPSNPTMKLPTPVPAAVRSAPPPSSSGKPLRTVISPGVTIVRPEAAQWQAHPTVSGATLKLLYRDPRAGIYTALLRLAPGTVFPRRRHAASEEVLLISGLATIGSFELRAGEYCRAESESIHEPITTSTGCTLFVCGSENDEFLDDT